jgi:hypothetical protein
MKGLVFNLGLLMISCSLLAQEDEELSSGKNPIQFSFQFGANNQFDHEVGVDQFERLFPGSQLLADRSDELEPTLFSNNSASAYFSLGLHYVLHQRKKSFGELRASLIFQSSTALASSLYFEERQGYDTLTSSRGSEPVFVDSVYRESLDMNLNLNQLALDVSYLNYWAGNSKFTFYAGLGLIGGLSLNSEVLVNSFTSNTEEYYLNDENLFRGGDGEFLDDSETKSIGVYFFMQPYLPLGLDIRLSKTKPFLEQTHFFLEARPGFTFVSTEELGSIINPSLQFGIGFKVHFARK